MVAFAEAIPAAQMDCWLSSLCGCPMMASCLAGQAPDHAILRPRVLCFSPSPGHQLNCLIGNEIPVSARCRLQRTSRKTLLDSDMRLVLTLFLWFSALTLVHAARDGDLDVAFGSGGFRLLDTAAVAGVPTNERGVFAARLPDGRLLVVMQAQQGPMQRAITAVFSADGTALLSSQELPVQFSAANIDPPLRGFGLDADGALYIGGTATLAGSDQALVLKVLAPDYTTLDPNYGQGGVATLAPLTTTSFLNAMHVDASGRVVICGDGRLPDGPMIGFCTRFLANGTRDDSFADGYFVISDANVALEIIKTIAPASNGGYLIAGQARLNDGQRYTLLARLTELGSLDPSFCAPCTGASVAWSAPGYRVQTGPLLATCPRVAERPDGVIVVAGIDYAATASRITYRSFFQSGQGTGFGITSSFTNLFAHSGCLPALSAQPDNKVVLDFTLQLSGIQHASLIRFPIAPTLTEPFDGTFNPEAEFMRAPLPDSQVSASNECNYALVEADGILCVGLTLVSSDPLNIDLMLVRVLNGTQGDLFADGFE